MDTMATHPGMVLAPVTRKPERNTPLAFEFVHTIAEDAAYVHP